MVYKLLLKFGSKYAKEIRNFPYTIFRLRKILLLSRKRVLGLYPNNNLSRLAVRLASPSARNVLVKNVYNNIIGSSNRQQDAALRLYRMFSASVEQRHKFDSHKCFESINKVSKICIAPPHSHLFGHFRYKISLPQSPSSAFIFPKNFIAAGCNSAVWSVNFAQPNETDVLDSQNELAVKVLYNYYDNLESSRETDPRQDANIQDKSLPPHCVLLHRQIKRECELRPQNEHPNIVPLIDHFVDYAPLLSDNVDVKSTSTFCATTRTTVQDANLTEPVGNQAWQNIEMFPEAFAGRPLTFYMLMPKYEATLDDLLKGNWPLENQKSYINPLMTDDSKSQTPSLLASEFDSSCSMQSIPRASNVELDRIKPYTLISGLTNEDVVCILAQLFEAVAELEKQGVAHRDIKPNNILVSMRTKHSVADVEQYTQVGDSKLSWLNEDEVRRTSSRFHVALTDFGCAIRVKSTTNLLSTTATIESKLSQFLNSIIQFETSNPDLHYLTHSGNLSLMAPEIACALHKDYPCLTSADYEKSDLWALSTIVYSLVGMPNPFVDGTLSSLDYDEMKLPALPPNTPWVLTWLVSNCLKRSPSERPSADFVADVLHTWCSVEHFKRRANSSSIEYLTQLIVPLCQLNFDESGLILNWRSIEKLYTLVNIFWAADWITGAAKAPNGLRVRFYTRVTPTRLAVCLRMAYLQDYICHDNENTTVKAAAPPFTTFSALNLPYPSNTHQ